LAFGRAIELDPKNEYLHRRRGNLLCKLGRHGEALAAFDRAIELDPQSARAHGMRGVELAELGRWEEALAAFDRAIELDPKNAFTRNGRGNVLRKLGRPEDAFAEYERAIDLDPRYAAPHQGRGNLLHRQGHHQEALAEYGRAVELDPKGASAHSSRGNVLCTLGRHREAVAAFGQALDLDPGDTWTLNNLAWLLATCPDVGVRDPARAVGLAKKAVAAAPDDGSFWNTLGVALYRAGEMRASLEALEESMRRASGGSAYDWYVAAMAHARLGDAEKARALYDRAVAWNKERAPDDAELRRFRDEAAGVLGLR
jgi:tetratricopeptide (TPR) repeat protein